MIIELPFLLYCLHFLYWTDISHDFIYFILLPSSHMITYSIYTTIFVSSFYCIVAYNDQKRQTSCIYQPMNFINTKHYNDRYD